MRQLSILLVMLLLPFENFAQEKNTLRTGITAEQNLAAIANIAPGAVGGYGMDERYAGTKGSPMLFDDLTKAYMRIEGQDIYLTVDANIDIIKSLLVFMHPSTKRMMSIQPEVLIDVVFDTDDGEKTFRSTAGMLFDKPLKGVRFCQILYEGEDRLFLKVPIRTFREADYRNAYSADRRYDEFVASEQYYLTGNKGKLTRVTLNKGTLEKLYPGKKDLIRRIIESGQYQTPEEMFIKVLGQL